MCLVCVALIAYFVETGNARLLLFGEALDFTERTFIWQHALSYYSAAPWLGVGINGFWTQPDVKALFIEHHRWFLNDYHNGYIGIAMETGAIGYALFSLSYLFYALDIGRSLRRGAALADEAGIALLYTCLMFFIDFTELVFMRSTNIAATMIAMCFFMAYARAPRFAGDSPREAAAQPRLPGWRRGRRFARQARQ